MESDLVVTIPMPEDIESDPKAPVIFEIYSDTDDTLDRDPSMSGDEDDEFTLFQSRKSNLEEAYVAMSAATVQHMATLPDTSYLPTTGVGSLFPHSKVHAPPLSMTDPLGEFLDAAERLLRNLFIGVAMLGWTIK